MGADLKKGQHQLLAKRKNRLAHLLQLLGKRFGSWRVLRLVGMDKSKNAVWLCECNCGAKHRVSATNLNTGRSTRCLSCSKTVHGMDCWRKGKVDLRYTLYVSAKRRARLRGIRFSISLTDVVIPKKCPLLGVELRAAVGRVQDNSPSLDRRDPTKGYTPRNVWVISYKANRMKSNASVSELERLTRNLRGAL